MCDGARTSSHENPTTTVSDWRSCRWCLCSLGPEHTIPRFVPKNTPRNVPKRSPKCSNPPPLVPKKKNTHCTRKKNPPAPKEPPFVPKCPPDCPTLHAALMHPTSTSHPHPTLYSCCHNPISSFFSPPQHAPTHRSFLCSPPMVGPRVLHHGYYGAVYGSCIFFRCKLCG